MDIITSDETDETDFLTTYYANYTKKEIRESR